MFCKKYLALVGYSSISAYDGHWQYVIDIIQHEKAEKPIPENMENWLCRYVYVADYG
jgi:hypothetical protein